MKHFQANQTKNENLGGNGAVLVTPSLIICYFVNVSPHAIISFGLMCMCERWCVSRIKPGDKAESSCVRISLCDSVKTFRLFIAEMMPSRINMPKSSYQLHNGQATWLRSKQQHPRRGDVYAYIDYVCACSYLQCIYNLRRSMCVHFCVCVYVCVFECMCTQGALIKGPW